MAASLAARAAAAGLRHVANHMPDGNQTVTLSEAQISAARAYASSQGISLRQAVLQLYNLNLID
ncbi:MAG: hypothetical protein EB023_13000 [Flavobacteriia bacterium]|nr:hypothetical protein [Flavobacteriia bacterium]